MPRIGQRDFDFDRQVAVMAVINRTPDSFYDRGATFELDRAIGAALTAASEGADQYRLPGSGYEHFCDSDLAIDKVAVLIIMIGSVFPQVLRHYGAGHEGE